jgi:hypothetical protein
MFLEFARVGDALAADLAFVFSYNPVFNLLNSQLVPFGEIVAQEHGVVIASQTARDAHVIRCSLYPRSDFAVAPCVFRVGPGGERSHAEVPHRQAPKQEESMVFGMAQSSDAPASVTIISKYVQS